jgi:hypothetical protein
MQDKDIPLERVLKLVPFVRYDMELLCNALDLATDDAIFKKIIQTAPKDILMRPKIYLPARLADRKMETEFVLMLDECIQRGFNLNTNGYRLEHNILLKDTTQKIHECVINRNEFLLTKILLQTLFANDLPDHMKTESFQSLLIQKYAFDENDYNPNPLNWSMSTQNYTIMRFWIKERPYFNHLLKSQAKCRAFEHVLEQIFAMLGTDMITWRKFLRHCGFFGTYRTYDYQTLVKIYQRFETVATPTVLDRVIDRIGSHSSLKLFTRLKEIESIKKRFDQTSDQMFNSLNLSNYVERLTCYKNIHSLDNVTKLHSLATNKSQKVFIALLLLHDVPAYFAFDSDSELINYEADSFEELIMVCIGNIKLKMINYDFLFKQNETLLDQMITFWDHIVIDVK